MGLPLALHSLRFKPLLLFLPAHLFTTTIAALAIQVRFYADGDPPHIAPVSRILVNQSTLAASRRRRRLSVSMETSETNSGNNPNEVGNLTSNEDDVSSNDTESLSVAPVVHVCGNGVRSTAEECDDNNTVGGDGCDAMCNVETGFECVSSTQSSGSGVGGLDTCGPRCGDGIELSARGLEDCDDNNTVSGDGCNATCFTEVGYTCTGGSLTSQSTCVTACGDGLRAGSEACDDGNQVAGDGCSAACTIEDGYTCSGGSVTSADSCTACHASCATCTGTSYGDCATCGDAYPFTNTLEGCIVDAAVEHCMVCLSDCTPVGKYELNGACTPCHASCGTCSNGESLCPRLLSRGRACTSKPLRLCVPRHTTPLHATPTPLYSKACRVRPARPDARRANVR